MSRFLTRSSAPPSRRQFLESSLGAAAAFAVGHPRSRALARQRPRAVVPADRPLRLAFAGIGNRGLEMIKTFATTGLTTVTALCDVDLDARLTQEARDLYPSAPRFRDARRMIDEAGSTFDAIVIATPDHSHFPLTVHAMAAGRHVYLEKPMARTFREAELLMALAERTGVVTQMGNQGHSGNNYFQFKAWTEAGVIADVTRIVAFMNDTRQWHGWKVDGYPEGSPLPAGLDWDLWHASRPARPYSPMYHPKKWRGWFAYGTGALGDWGAHIIDTAHRFLALGLPTVIEAVKLDQPSPCIYPQASTLRFEFPARGSKPPVELWWYDGQTNRPPLPAELGPGASLSELGGKFIFSKTLAFRGGTHGDTLRIIPESRMQELAPRLPKITGGFSDHATNFVLACQGKEEARSPFSVAGPLTQVLQLGTIAQQVGGRLEFDPRSKTFTNSPEATALLAPPQPREGWATYYRS